MKIAFKVLAAVLMVVGVFRGGEYVQYRFSELPLAQHAAEVIEEAVAECPPPQKQET